MLFALVHYPNIDGGQIIDQFRKKYDPQVHLIPPHITLMFPLPEVVGEDHLIHHLESALWGWQPFPLHLHGIQISPDGHVFLLIQEGKAGLIRLHDQIYTGLLTDYLREDIPFIPHLTLGVSNKASNDRERILWEAKHLAIDCHCVLDKLHLLKINADRSKIVWSREFSLAA